MSEKSWKRTERRIAALLGGRRMPVSGRQRGSAPDVVHPWLSVEVKSRQKLPKWLKDALAQARAAATETQLSVAVLHEVGMKHDGDVVLMGLIDFQRFANISCGE